MIHHRDHVGPPLPGHHLVPPARLVGTQAEAAVEGSGAALHLHEAAHGALALHDALRRVGDQEVEAAAVVRLLGAGVDVEPPSSGRLEGDLQKSITSHIYYT